jgi:hypothetical protein
MPSTDRKPELKAKTSVAQTGSQPCVYAKGLILCGSQLWKLLANISGIHCSLSLARTYHRHWHNSPVWAQAFFRSFYQLSLFLQFFCPNFLASSITPSSHLSFGLPLCLFPSTTATRILPVALCSSSQITCPACLSKLTFIYMSLYHSLYTVYIAHHSSPWHGFFLVSPCL